MIEIDRQGTGSRLTGRHAGIGRGLPRHFWREWCHVALLARNPEKKVLKFVAELACWETGRFFHCRRRDGAGSGRGVYHQTVQHFGAIDILLINAGGRGDSRRLGSI